MKRQNSGRNIFDSNTNAQENIQKFLNADTNNRKRGTLFGGLEEEEEEFSRAAFMAQRKQKRVEVLQPRGHATLGVKK